MADKDSYYLRIDTGFLIQPDENDEFIKHLSTITLNYFEEQESAPLGDS